MLNTIGAEPDTAGTITAGMVPVSIGVATLRGVATVGAAPVAGIVGIARGTGIAAIIAGTEAAIVVAATIAMTAAAIAATTEAAHDNGR